MRLPIEIEPKSLNFEGGAAEVRIGAAEVRRGKIFSLRGLEKIVQCFLESSARDKPIKSGFRPIRAFKPYLF